MNRVQELGPLPRPSFPFPSLLVMTLNAIVQGQNRRLMAAVALNQRALDPKRSNRRFHRGIAEEIELVFCQGLWLGLVAGLMALCQCHYVGVCSGAVSAQTDVTHTHSDACQEQEPPTPDTGGVPGPDTRSVVRRHVRQETDQCLPATCQSPSLTITSLSLSPLCPPSFPASLPARRII